MKPPVVLITGALTGIGRATALAFAHEGARLVVSGRRNEVGQALVTELRALWVWRLNTCAPTCATKTRCAA
jgi:NAD(P)-dependent dehydrogenase (short-subunit alcohol dehydrogenase family)